MISRETDITAKMRARKDPRSMLELCDIFKRKRELMWNLNDGSELDEDPSYKRILARSGAVDTTVVQRANANETGTDAPLRSTQTRRSTVKVYERQISLSHEKEDPLGDTTMGRRNNLLFSHVEKVTEVIESVDSEGFSDEEYYADTLHENNLTQTSSQRQKMYMKGNHGQAPELYRQAVYEEMGPQQKDHRGMYRNVTTQERRRRDTRHCPQYQAAFSSSQANAAGYSYNQVQGRTERKVNQPHHHGVYEQQNMPRSQKIGPPQQPRRQTTRTPIPQFKAALPCQTNGRPEVHGHRRLGRQEADCKEKNQSERRRTGVCQDTDDNRKHRTFARVLNKRFSRLRSRRIETCSRALWLFYFNLLLQLLCYYCKY